MSTKPNTAPLARYADKKVTPVITDFVEWLQNQTGVEVDPLSVYIASALRGEFQKSEGNQKRIAAQRAQREAEAKARADRKVARAEEAAAKQSEAAAVAKVRAEAAKTPAKAAAKQVPGKKAAAARPLDSKLSPVAKPTASGRRRPVAPSEATV